MRGFANKELTKINERLAKRIRSRHEFEIEYVERPDKFLCAICWSQRERRVNLNSERRGICNGCSTRNVVIYEENKLETLEVEGVGEINCEEVGGGIDSVAVILGIQSESLERAQRWADSYGYRGVKHKQDDHTLEYTAELRWVKRNVGLMRLFSR